MIEKLREQIFAWILKRQAARKVVMPQWNAVRSVAVLYPNNNIQHIIKQIEQADKEVVLFTLPDKKQINWLTERPKAEERELLVARKFDVLIDLTQTPSRTMQYMAMDIRADFKVGRFIREGIHDMTIDTVSQETPDFLFEQIIKYIKMFSQK
jgi:pyridoxine 5'-phosphate synthase PdxJ